MFAQKLRVVSIVLVLSAAVLACGWLLAADRPEDPKPPGVAPLPPDATPGGRILLMRQGGLAVLSPDGKELLAGKLGPQDAISSGAWLSPDGKRLAYLIHFGDSPINKLTPAGILRGQTCDSINKRKGGTTVWPARQLDCWSLIGRIGE